MKPLVKFLFKSKNSCLPTSLPVYFYGLPNEKVYAIYARFYEVKFDVTSLEFVLAICKDFSYNPLNGEIYLKGNKKNGPVSLELLNMPDPKLKIVKSYRNMYTFKDAIEKLEKRSVKQFRKKQNQKAEKLKVAV